MDRSTGPRGGHFNFSSASGAAAAATERSKEIKKGKKNTDRRNHPST